MVKARQLTIRCVGGLIYDADGRLLLVQRANEPGRGRWSVPGGRVEDGETDAAAVVREVAEETGLRVQPTRLSGVVWRPGPSAEITYHIHDYLCVIVGGTAVAGTDATALRWVDRAGFAALEQAGELVGELANNLRDWRALPD